MLRTCRPQPDILIRCCNCMNEASSGVKPKPKFTPKAPPKKEIVEPVAAPVVVPRYTKFHTLKYVII